jgi:hypothetical protein
MVSHVSFASALKAEELSKVRLNEVSLGMILGLNLINPLITPQGGTGTRIKDQQRKEQILSF